MLHYEKKKFLNLQLLTFMKKRMRGSFLFTISLFFNGVINNTNIKTAIQAHLRKINNMSPIVQF